MAEPVATEVRVHGAALASLRWSGLRSLLLTVTSPLLTLVLARWLTPADFGVVSVGIMIVSLGLLVQGTGLSQALVREAEPEIDGVDSTIFWTTMALSAALYLVIWGAAPLVARSYKTAELTWVLRMLAWRLPLSAIALVPQALAQRRFEFRQIAWAQFAGTVTPFIVAVPLAMRGHGDRALVWGMLAGGLVNVVVLWMQVDWWPEVRWSGRDVRSLRRFGILVTIEALQVWVLSQADNGLVSVTFGIATLGIYATGFNVAFYAVNAVIDPVLPVAYSVFSRLRADRSAVRQSYIQLTRLVVATAMPLGIGVAVIARPLMAVAFGPDWHSMAPVLEVFGIYGAVAALWSVNSEVCKALDRPGWMTWAYGGILLYALPVWTLGAALGFHPFLAARGSVMLVAMGMHLAVVRGLLGIGAEEWWAIARGPLVAGAGMAVGVLLERWWWASVMGPPTSLQLGMLVATGAITYALLLRVLDREAARECRQLAWALCRGFGR